MQGTQSSSTSRAPSTQLNDRYDRTVQTTGVHSTKPAETAAPANVNASQLGGTVGQPQQEGGGDPLGFLNPFQTANAQVAITPKLEVPNVGGGNVPVSPPFELPDIGELSDILGKSLHGTWSGINESLSGAFGQKEQSTSKPASTTATPEGSNPPEPTMMSPPSNDVVPVNWREGPPPEDASPWATFSPIEWRDPSKDFSTKFQGTDAQVATTTGTAQNTTRLDTSTPQLDRTEVERLEREAANAQYLSKLPDQELGIELEMKATEAFQQGVTYAPKSDEALAASGLEKPPRKAAQIIASGKKWSDLSPKERETVRPYVTFGYDESAVHSGQPVFDSGVEFASPNVGELKFRTQGDTGKALDLAYGRMEGWFDAAKFHHSIHVHKFGTLPDDLSEDHAERFKLVDFIGRANKWAELFLIKQTGELSLSHSTGVSSALLDELNRDLAQGEGHSNRTLVAYRWGEEFDSPKLSNDQYSIETRIAAHAGHSPDIKLLERAIQRGMLTGYYGVSSQSFSDWYSTQIQQSTPETGNPLQLQADLLHDLPYTTTAPNEKWSTVDWKSNVESLIGEQDEDFLKAFGYLTPNKALRLLVQDFSKDLALWDKPESLKKVEEARMHALQALVEVGVPPGSWGRISSAEVQRFKEETKEIVKQFVTDSGLLEVYAESLGMNDPIFSQMD